MNYRHPNQTPDEATLADILYSAERLRVIRQAELANERLDGPPRHVRIDAEPNGGLLGHIGLVEIVVGLVVAWGIGFGLAVL